MSPDQRRVRLIRERLATLYPDASSARRIASDAGISLSRVDFHGSAQEIWFSLLGESTRTNQIDALIDWVRNEYPNDELLALVQLQEAELPPVPDDLARAGVWRQLLVVLGPELGLPLIHPLVQRARIEDATRNRDKPYQLRTVLRKHWPGGELAHEIAATLEELDDDLRNVRGVTFGVLAQVPGARFIVTTPERAFERVTGDDTARSATDVREGIEVRPGDLVRTRGDRRDAKDLERLLGAERVDWIKGPPEAGGWRQALRRWFDEGYRALLVGFDGEQTEKALEELREICERDEPDVYVLLEGERSVPAGLSIAADRVLALKEGRLAPLWLERLRDAIEIKKSREDLQSMSAVAAYYGATVEEEFKVDVQRVRDALEESRFMEAQTLAEKLLGAAEARSRRDYERWGSWALRCRLNLATAQINLQRNDEARETLREVTDKEISTQDARIQATFAEQLAILGEPERARGIISHLPEVPSEDVERVTVARWRVALARGEVPAGEAPKHNYIYADLAQFCLDNGDLAKCTEHALRILGDDTRPLDRLIASRLLLIALERTALEDPPFQTSIPIGVRSQVVEALERNLRELLAFEPPFPRFRRSALTLALGFYELSGDPERIEQVRQSLLEMGEQEGTAEEAIHETMARHLRRGRDDLAREALPSLSPQWRRTQLWLAALDAAGQSERALREALVLSPGEQSPGPMAGLIAALLVRAARFEDALVHARRAFEEVPVRGARAALAECLGRLRRLEEAERVASPLADTKNPPWMWMLATIASNLRRHDAAERWRAVIAVAPDDVHARGYLANALQDRGQTEEAADEAWQCLALGLEERLTLEDLQRIAMRQRMAGIATRTDRLRRIAEVLAARFPGNAQAETVRFQLLAALDFPEDLPPANYELLESGGALYRASIDDVVTQQRQRAKAAALAHFWYRLGNLTFDAFSELVQIEPAVLVRGFSEAAGEGKALLSAPVRIGPEFQKLDLRSSRLLLGHLEVLLLQRLDLLGPLCRTLGTEGRLVMFRDVHDAIHESAARVEQSTQRVQLAECERLHEHIHRSPAITLLKDAWASDDDHAWAHAQGLAVIEAHSEFTAPIEAKLLPPRQVAEQLHRAGHIDTETHRRLLQRLTHEHGDPALPALLPQPVAITYGALVTFFEAGALDALAQLFGRPVAVGPRTEALVRSRRDELARTVESADLARALPRSTNSHCTLIERSEGVDLPSPHAASGGDRAFSDTSVLALRQALSIYQALSDDNGLQAVTADWFVWRPDSAEEAWRRLDWSTAHDALSRAQDLLQTTRARVWSFTDLLGGLGLGDREEALRLELARMGFTDALTPEALLGLVRRFNALDGAVARRVFDSIEHMVRTFTCDLGEKSVEGVHLGRVPAALAVALLYAKTVASMFAPAAFGPEVRARCARTLFDRLESLAGESMLDVVGMAASVLANETIRRLDEHITLEKHRATLRSDGPVILAWRELSSWALGTPSRTSAVMRGYRRLLLTLDGQDEGTFSGLVRYLLANVADGSVSTGGVVDLTGSPWRDLALLSSEWRDRPLARKSVNVRSDITQRAEDVDCERLLVDGAKQLTAGDVAPAPSFLEARFEVALMGGGVRLRVRAPIEALLLRVPPEQCAEPARVLAALNGLLDPATRTALHAFADHPERSDMRREVARASLRAPWRMIREDPNGLLFWRPDARLGFEITPSSIAQLRALLSEPPSLLPTGGILDWLPARLQDDGHWGSREDSSHLFLRAASVPWPIFAVAHLGVEGGADPQEVALALELLEAPEERPVGELCANLAFLHHVAAKQRYVRTEERELDMETELSAAWLRALRSAVSDPGTRRAEAMRPLGDHEASLLRRCGRVVSDLKARFEPLPVRDGLWLTWQLYNWLIGVLDTLPVSERASAIESIARAAPPPAEVLGDNRDLWNPFGFDRFEHRLAALLHAYVVGHDVSHQNQGGAVGSEAIEEFLLHVAQRPSTPFDDEMRSLGAGCTCFEWYASGAVPDLALTALLSMNFDGFARLPEQERLLWLARLPQVPGQRGCVDDVLASRIVASVTRVLSTLSRVEQVGFREYLGVVETRDPEHTFAWKLIGFTALFTAGFNELGDLVRAGVLLAPERLVAKACFAEYLTARTRESPALLYDEMESLLSEVTAPAARVAIALAPARLVLNGDAVHVAAATAWLKGVAARPEFAHDEGVFKVMHALGLGGTGSNSRP